MNKMYISHNIKTLTLTNPSSRTHISRQIGNIRSVILDGREINNHTANPSNRASEKALNQIFGITILDEQDSTHGLSKTSINNKPGD